VKTNNKIVVIGLDGATWDLLLPFVEQGELPLFKKWITEGCYGDLQSTIPALTPPGWTSGFTGVNPGKHNIFDFFVLDKTAMKLKLTTSKDRKYPAFWEIASKEGVKVGLFNVPCSYPADKVNGFMVTGMATPEDARGFGYPGDVEEMIRNSYKGYSFGAKASLLESGKKDEFLRDIYRVTDIQEEAAKELLEKHDADLFLFVYDEIDRVMHFFWHDFDKTHPSFSNSTEFRDAILDYYKRIEKGISGFLSCFTEDVDLVIFSDHGFGPLEKDIYVNKLLYEWGFLQILPSANEIINKPLWKKALKKVVPPEIRKALREKVKASPLADPLGYIDFEKSKAFYASVSGRSIYILDKKNQETIIKELKHKLENYEDEETGVRPFDRVFARDEIYKGPYADDAPDLVIQENGKYAFKVEWSDSAARQSFQHGCLKSGSHRPNGIILCSGGSFKKGLKIEGAKICDMAPTLLCLLGLPAGTEMDGRVLNEIFNTEKHSGLKEYANYRNSENADAGSEDEQKVKDKLKSLGYM
jgi:predicted AlkP superfamily phosphohydrolase/phosphomutase